MANFPVSLDSLANPTATTLRNDPGFELHTVISTLNDIAEQLEAKLGIGATTPDAIHKALKATAAGTSVWDYYGLPLIASGSPNGANISVTPIAGNWGGLLIWLYVRGSKTAATDTLLMQFNADTGSVYDIQRLFANVTSTAASEAQAQASIEVATIPAASATANRFGEVMIWIPEYAGSTNQKIVRSNYASVSSTASGAIIVGQHGGCWRPASPAAITRVDLFPATGNLLNGSKYKIYGLPAV